MINYSLSQSNTELDLSKDEHQQMLALGLAVVDDKNNWRNYSKDQGLLIATLLQDHYQSKNN